MENKKLIFGIAGLILLGVLIFIIAGIITAINVLDANEVGIRYSQWGKTIDETQLYTQGVHFWGFFNNFYKFKTDFSSVNDKIQIRTKDGMRLTIEISYQFTYSRQILQLVSLWKKFDYNKLDITLIRIQRDILRTISAENEVEVFVFNISSVNNSLNQGLKAYLTNFAIQVQNFQILEITYPKNYNNAILDTQNQRLKINEAQNNLKKVEEQLQGLIEKSRSEAAVFFNNYKQKTLKETEKVYKNIEILKNFVQNINQPLTQIKNIFGESKLPEYILLEFMKKIKNISYYPYTPLRIKELYSSN